MLQLWPCKNTTNGTSSLLFELEKIGNVMQRYQISRGFPRTQSS